MIVKYLRSGNKTSLILFIVLYVISILAKQQSMQLPLIILLLTVIFKNELSEIDYKRLKAFSIAGVLLMAGSLVVMLIFYGNNMNFFPALLWKKPLVVPGSLVMIVFPFKTDLIYRFFAENVKLSLAVCASVLVVLTYFLYRYRKTSKTIVLLAGAILISFFPVILSETSLRTLSIQAIVIYISLAVILSKYFFTSQLRKCTAFGFVSLLLVSNVCSAYENFNNEFALNNFRTDYLLKLKDFTQKDENVFILAAPDNFLIPYEYNYFTSGKFGKSDIASSPVGYSAYFRTGMFLKNANTLIDVSFSNGIYEIKSRQGNIGLSLNSIIGSQQVISIINSKIGLRGYESLSIKLSDEYKNSRKIFYDGIEWKELN